MSLAAIIRSVISAQEEGTIQLYTLEELLNLAFVEKFTRVGSMEQFLTQTQLTKDIFMTRLK